MARGAIEEGELAAAVEAVREQMDTSDEVPEPGVVLRVDKPEAADMPPAEVDCGARMHICQAVCCRLDFALAYDEVERGVLRWDMGRPYLIRHEADGYCVHNDALDRRLRRLRRPPHAVPCLQLRGRRADLDRLRRDGAQHRVDRGEPRRRRAAPAARDAGGARRRTAAR